MHLAPVQLQSDQSPQEIVDAITGNAKSSFSLGMKLLSRPRREAMRSVYAFCRVVDDIADGDIGRAEKLDLLQQWRNEIDYVFAGAPRSDVGAALLEPIRRYQLPKDEFVLMIEGMEMDANGPIVAPSRGELARYTRCVAGSVGLLSMRIFGAWKGDVSRRFALALADALQLTNILRDVEEDAQIGRLYLPSEMLEKAKAPVSCDEIVVSNALPLVRQQLGLEAKALFQDARSLISSHDRASLAPALAMMGVYEGYLVKLEASGWTNTPPLKMSKLEKFARGIFAALFARSS